MHVTGIVCLEIGILADGCLRLIWREDMNSGLTINESVYKKMLLYCAAVGSWIEIFLSYWEWHGQLACGVLAAYLLVASIQDSQTCEVYDFLHVLALPTGMFFIVATPSGEKVMSLVLYLVIQLGIFMKMYGAGDGLAFLVCAVYESRFGKGLSTYLLHMAAVFVVLLVVQGARRNINKTGNLKKPVALVPYIAATVWFFL